MTDREEFERICTIENEAEGQILGAMLEEMNLPHVVVSHRDTAFDGVYEEGAGWGHIEAPPGNREEILALVESLNHPDAEGDDEDEDIL